MKQDQIYQPKNVPLYEAIYGKHLISLGNEASIENMFQGIDLKNKKALDIGFGLGGVAFYLAQKYHCQVRGVEIYPWMVEHAKNHAPSHISHLVDFALYNENGEIPFDAKSFDIVYSKGVLNHVHDKAPLFTQINRMLKKNGLLVIADWIAPKEQKDLAEPIVQETKASYAALLEKAGFGDIAFRDDSHLFRQYANELLRNLKKNQSFIESEFGKKMFDEIWRQHEQLIVDISEKQKCAVRILASKA